MYFVRFKALKGKGSVEGHFGDRLLLILGLDLGLRVLQKFNSMEEFEGCSDTRFALFFVGLLIG